MNRKRRHSPYYGATPPNRNILPCDRKHLFIGDFPCIKDSVYIDDGISGTNTKKRDEFNRMIDECMADNIDMVITKSISRFARNTLDCLQYIRQLKDKNIPVYFEKEAINTLDAKGEVLITIMASLAQQESQSMSQNIKLGLQYLISRVRCRSITIASSDIQKTTTGT